MAALWCFGATGGLTGRVDIGYTCRLSIRSGKVNKKAASAAFSGRNHHLSVFNISQEVIHENFFR